MKKNIEAVDMSHCSVCGEITTNREEVSVAMAICKPCYGKIKKIKKKVIEK